MKCRFFYGYLVILVITFLISCEYAEEESSVISTTVDAPPFIVTEPVCETIEKPGYYKYTGIIFDFMNTGQKIIDEVTFSFMLYDSKTYENPFIGSNRFSIKKLDIILPNENKEIAISLDQYIYIAPKTPYLIDFFYISKIHFTDGSSWEDIYGLFKIK
ncbi:MAG: hypothetical protein FWC03_04140 [Treponema sp.]|nr:hypothetical protein [Treponema sp.]